MSKFKQRRASLGMASSLIGAAPLNSAATNQIMTDVEESPETLQNIMRVTRDQESVFKVLHESPEFIIQIISNFNNI